ncbi:MAG: cobyrinate a,c-diamide synthase [Prevotella sp.]|nr:cobyrinate a,c-diamide synthase [Prevotella sp.]
MKSFLIAAPSSGQGKTTVSRALMTRYVSQGLKVQPFKCGPDYIDTKFHETVCGRPSVNLDTFMASPEHIRQLFNHYSAGADVSIVEGMMGFFDGYDRERGSAYEVARILGLPVVLVADARSAAYSMAALLSGFINFRSDVSFAGVIFNRVGSPRHEAMLRQVCDDIGLPCLACLPNDPDLEIGSRYLGLDFSTEKTSTLNSPLQLCWLATKGTQEFSILKSHTSTLKSIIARNSESFSFIYQETIDLLGPDVSFFDPEKDVPALDDADFLLLPGGYPEKHLAALRDNEPCRETIRRYAERGGRVVAECGGMMYLCQAIESDDGPDGAYPMCGVLPYTISARREHRHLSLGYRSFELFGREFRGHEFHYTQFLGEGSAQPESVCQVYNAKGQPVPTPVFHHNNVLASYTHLRPADILFAASDNRHLDN